MMIMSQDKAEITVYYDGACPRCVKDREHYEKLAGKAGEQVCWFDITGREDQLKELGINPRKALTELHVMDEHRQILSEIDAYVLLLKKIPRFKLLAWFINLPLIKPLISKIYHYQVTNRLKRSGRI
jgi:predicted DCC family thiol-disulfide oxidoreductase YuxK